MKQRLLQSCLVAVALLCYASVWALSGGSFEGRESNPAPAMNSLWTKTVAGVSGLSPVPEINFATSEILAVSQDGTVCDDGMSKCGKIFLLDSSTGTLKQTISWTAPLQLRRFDTQPEILPVSDNRFLIKTADELRLFSSDGNELQRRHLPLESIPAKYNPKLTLWSHWQLAASPDGTAALLTLHRAGVDEAEEHWISIDSLQDETVEQAPSYRCCRSINGNSIAFDIDAGNAAIIAIREKGKSPRTLCDSCAGRDPMFLDLEHILVNTRPGASFAVMSTTGAVEYRTSLGAKKDAIFFRSAAPAAQRVAFVWTESTFRPNQVRMADYHVSVFDLAKRKTIAELLIEAQPQHNSLAITMITPTIALSPDGNKLAVLQQSSVKVLSIGH